MAGKYEDNMWFFEQISVPLYHYCLRTENNIDIVALTLTDSPNITIVEIEVYDNRLKVKDKRG